MFKPLLNVLRYHKDAWEQNKAPIHIPYDVTGDNRSRPDLERKEKMNLNFYFRTFLWYLKRFYKGLRDLHKSFRGTTKKCENKDFS